MKRFLRILGPVLVLLIFVVALRFLHNTLKHYSLSEIFAAMAKISTGQIVVAVGLTIVSYIILVGYDLVATRFVGLQLPLWKVALGAFAGYTFSYNFGATLAGTTVRGRLYAAWNVPVLKIVELLVILGLTFWFGLFFVAGILCLVWPLDVPAELLRHLPLPGHAHFHFEVGHFEFRVLGAILLAIALAYIAVSAFHQGRLKVLRWEIPVPPFRLTRYQYAIATADLLVASGVLYALMPSAPGITFTTVLGVYILAYVAEVICHVPSGVGIFDSIIVGMLAGGDPGLPPSIFASVLMFRVIYRLAPLLLGATLFAMHEIALNQQALSRLVGASNKLLPPIAPQLAAALVFLAGAILLVTAVTPTPFHIERAQLLLPLAVVEISHFLGAAAGLLLLLIARGILHRFRGSYRMALAMMAVGIACSIGKGLEFEEAGLLLLLMLALTPFRMQFLRARSSWRQPLGVGSLIAVVVVLLCAVWFGMFTYRHVEFSRDMFGQFAFAADAPRFLRAMAGATALLAVYCLARLWRPALTRAVLPARLQQQLAQQIAAASPESYAHLALLGDKKLLFNEDGNAMLMYAVRRSSWVTMGDPVGPNDAQGDLIWRFSDLCDSADARPVFYHVRQDNLPRYVELGLTVLKLGEEARVALPDFTLDCPERRPLRQTCERFAREGCTLEIVAKADVAAMSAELRQISDAWLSAKHAREKRFSLGFFRESYLAETPLATVRQNGRLVAFANLWEAAGREELAADLMRHLPDAPDWVMEFLYIQLMLWGKQQGYRWFNLGMAPVFELEHRELMPIWERVGTTVFRHGDDFYNFQGLRQYKEKFVPQWRPMYLAAPGGLTMRRALVDIADLISNGSGEKARAGEGEKG
jgi:phosphatidylglycerol lysyltransferase